ncbi:hypothetical protein GGF32_004065 [Allomyces javanicus]|nr:hypothetical protein GGF32_004065 [Allomyces javanicus]
MFPSSCLTGDVMQEGAFRVGDVANEIVQAEQSGVKTRKWYIVMPRRDKHRRFLLEGAPARMTSRKWTLLWLAKAVPPVTDTLSLILPVFSREMVAAIPLAPTLRELSLANWPAPRIFPLTALVSRLPPSLVSLMIRTMDFSLTDLVHPLVLPPRLHELQLYRVRTQRVLDQRYIAHLQQHGPVGAVLDAFTTNARHLATMHVDQLDGTNIDPAGWLEHVPWSVNRLSIVGHQVLDAVADAIIARYGAVGPRRSGAPRVCVIVSECSFSPDTRARLCATPGIDVTLRQCFVPGCQDEVNLDDLLL